MNKGTAIKDSGTKSEPMTWYSADIQPNSDRDYPNCLVKTKDGRYLLTYWQSFMKKFIIDDGSLVKLDTDQIEKWCIIAE